MHRKQNGFGTVGIIVTVVAVLVSASAIGFYLFYRSKHDDAPVSQAQSTQQAVLSAQQMKDDEEPKELSLAEGKVLFTVPHNWTFTEGSDECRYKDGKVATCVSGANITPGEKLPTRYNKGKDHFKINIAVYENPEKLNAQAWVETGLSEAKKKGEVNESSESVNGYSSFYRDQNFDKNGATVREVEYSFTKGDIAIVVFATTFDSGTLQGGRAVGDFRKFESDIDEMARSIVIDSKTE